MSDPDMCTAIAGHTYFLNSAASMLNLSRANWSFDPSADTACRITSSTAPLVCAVDGCRDPLRPTAIKYADIANFVISMPSLSICTASELLSDPGLLAALLAAIDPFPQKNHHPGMNPVP